MPLPDVLAAVAANSNGLFSRARARELGVDDRELQALVQKGHAVRVRRGHYADATVWQAYDAGARHLLRARAALANAGPESHLAHVSALVAHGADLLQPDLSQVHLVRDVHSGRRESGCVHSGAELPAGDRVTVDALRACSPARASVDYARDPEVSLQQSVVAMDSLLRAGTLSQQDLLECVERARAWSGSRRLVRAVGLSDPRSGSAGESKCRVGLTLAGFPPEELQVRVVVNGHEYFSDFGWISKRTLGEFDGRWKFGRWLRPGETPGDAAFRERRRELELESAGFVIVRFTFEESDDLLCLGNKMLGAFSLAERRGLLAG